jgi:hypothetical protein
MFVASASEARESSLAENKCPRPVRFPARITNHVQQIRVRWLGTIAVKFFGENSFAPGMDHEVLQAMIE